MAEPVKQQQARTAVVVVHGIGNQRPLATMREIVDAIYAHDVRVPEDEPTKIWTKLDRATGDLDLPVITTANLAQADGAPRPIDFHECYWAPLMAELRFLAVPLWLFELVRKGPGAMVDAIKPLWYCVGMLLTLWTLSAVLVGLTGLAALLGQPSPAQGSFMAALLPWLLAVGLCFALMGRRGALLLGVLAATLFGVSQFWSIATGVKADFPMALNSSNSLFWAAMALLLFVAMNWFFLLTVVGDAARYLRGSPGNIMVRRQIRRMGVDLLRHLHAAQWQGRPKYDRIIVVAHSLGTLVAYDMLRAYWSEVAPTLGNPHDIPGGTEQDDVSPPVKDMPWSDGERMAWRNRGNAILRALDPVMLASPLCFAEATARRWIVSDFVTLGSPLTHAQFLMAEGTDAEKLRQNFDIKQEQRELPTCPATVSTGDGQLSFKRQDRRRFHHGALFGLTRWTNLYFPVKALLWGDMVGGSLGRLFGTGIADVPVSGAPLGNLAAHTRYWKSNRSLLPTNSLRRMRDAISLRGGPDQSGPQGE
jgi:hypothetical protein